MQLYTEQRSMMTIDYAYRVLWGAVTLREGMLSFPIMECQPQLLYQEPSRCISTKCISSVRF